jgi:DNA segregation ATPase FtsK/SpoIIIE-like protein
LVGGTTGSGKTVLIRAWAGELAGLDDVALLGLDPKKTGLSVWEPRFTTIARSIPECTALMVGLWREVERRFDVLDQAGDSEWDAKKHGGPYIAAFIDELVQVTSIDGGRIETLLIDDATAVDAIGDKARSDRSRLLGSELQAAKRMREGQGVFLSTLARTCRAAGVQLIAATQYPTAEVVDAQLRQNLVVRIMLRVTSDEAVKVCLGDGAHEGITHLSIPVEQQGGCWVAGAAPGKPYRARGRLVSDDDIKRRALTTSDLRWPAAEVFVGQHNMWDGVNRPTLTQSTPTTQTSPTDGGDEPTPANTTSGEPRGSLSGRRRASRLA